MKFPEISGSNLEGENYTLPYDLKGELNIIIIPFLRQQQYSVNKWAAYLANVKKSYSFIDFYEVPTLAVGYGLMRFMIDGGMRAGIPNPDTREHTITLYTNKAKFKKKLGIKTEKKIYLYLVNRKGKILWQSEGEITEEKKNSLVKTLENYKK